jgi:oxygen-dependent protoporphyrinogen oxidase
MTTPRIIIVGGGISGLTLAWELTERLGARADVTVLEVDATPGGTMRTEEHNGWRIEAGPNGFLTDRPATLDLARRLGLSGELLPASAAAKRRYLLSNGVLCTLPTSPPAFLRTPLLSPRGRLRVLAEVFAPRAVAEDESLAEFGRRRIGAEAVAALLDPMVTGIYAGDPERLSVAAAFPRLHALERAHGSLTRGLVHRRLHGHTRGGPAGPGGVLTSFARGMGTLPRALAARLGTHLRTGARVTAIERAPPPGPWRVVTTTGVETARVLVLATPAYAAAPLLGPIDATAARLCDAIAYAPVAVVALGLREDAVAHPLDGFGFLVPSREGRRILGCVWSSRLYPGHRAPPGHVLLTTMVGGVRRPGLASLADGALVDLVRDELGAALGLAAGRLPVPDLVRVVRWPRAIPQYDVGHLCRVEALEARIAGLGGLYLAGNAYRGVAVNDCVARAVRLAERIAARCDAP